MSNKKALKASYKQMKFRVGVFRIINTMNNKVLIEGSVNLDSIIKRHQFELKSGAHKNEALQKDWNEFGADHFQFEILSEIQQDDNNQTDYRKEAKKLESMFIEEYQPFGTRGYHSGFNQLP
ncbi:MAG: GIY-YIG nuclease family protein [Sediminibacterium sp.]|nr:GIY-YIG nuclease family protein [Sediminibacterium sp.]